MPDKRKQAKYLKGKTALVMGLGIHGGGVATALWLVHHGAKVTVTDKRDKELLASSVRALKGVPVRYKLGGHDKRDFISHDIIVVNPGVPQKNEYLALAEKAAKSKKISIENDVSLFFRNSDAAVIGVTGTRGKTTTTLWVAELLKTKHGEVRPSGNTPMNALLKEFDRVQGTGTPVVAELSSWQLEYLPVSKRAPHVAVITNLYPDHLNRYSGIRAYASAKANIFRHQHEDDFLVLNHDNEWTPFFLAKKPKGIVFFISTKPLPRSLNGLFVRKEKLVFRFDGMEQQLFSVKRFIRERGAHNLENLLAAVLAVKLFDSSVHVSEKSVLVLPTPRMRQEVVFQNKELTVINDSCATSPDGTIAAIKRFAGQKNQRLILICGGTDKELEFSELATVIKAHILPENIILLNGSATTKLIGALRALGYDKKYPLVAYDELSLCVKIAIVEVKNQKQKTTILFSPGAASFEKFLHEFDRGEKFNALIKKRPRKVGRMQNNS